MDSILSFTIFLMKKTILTLVLSLALTACVDTTGISADSSKTPHPSTDANASVTVTEYGDLQCPSCKAAQDLVVKPLIAKYGKQIRFQFSQFPLSAIHPYALIAAEASECAADQGKFWEYVDMTFANQTSLSAASLSKWAVDLGLDMDLFTRCTKSHIKRSGILTEYRNGQQLGVGGTPTFFVNGKKVESTVAAISAAIDAAKAGVGSRL